MVDLYHFLETVVTAIVFVSAILAVLAVVHLLRLVLRSESAW